MCLNVQFHILQRCALFGAVWPTLTPVAVVISQWPPLAPLMQCWRSFCPRMRPILFQVAHHTMMALTNPLILRIHFCVCERACVFRAKRLCNIFSFGRPAVIRVSFRSFAYSPCRHSPRMHCFVSLLDPFLSFSPVMKRNQHLCAFMGFFHLRCQSDSCLALSKETSLGRVVRTHVCRSLGLICSPRLYH